MGADPSVMQNLALSIVSLSLLVLCGENAMDKSGTILAAVRWGATTILISVFYYVQWLLLLRCYRKRHRGLRYNQTRVDNNNNNNTNFGSENNSELNGDLEMMENYDGEPVQARVILYPELTMSSVWVYVYGWGMLLFICVHCLAGVDVSSSCWWGLGMMALCMDELILSGLKRIWVGFIALGLGGSVASIWCATLIDEDGNLREKNRLFTGSQRDGWNFLLGVVCPVAAPFIFFSLRPTIHSVTRDVSRLCELAMPFMIVISLFVLLGTDPEITKEQVPDDNNRRRSGSNNDSSVMIETVAKFASTYATSLPGDAAYYPDSAKTGPYLALVFSPLLAVWCIRMLIHSVLYRYVTEFLTAFLLVLSTRYCITHEFGSWSIITMLFSGFSFIIILLVRQV